MQTGDGSALRILVIDDHEIVREGLMAAMRADRGFAVVGAAATAAQGLQLARRLPLDVALVDLSLPDMGGNELCRELLAVQPSLAVVILSTYLSEDAVQNALRAGAAGYVTKAAGLPALWTTLREVSANPGKRPEAHASQIVKQLQHVVAARQGQRVTPQQERILELAAQGLTNRQIGERMYLSESTVRMHMQKLKTQTASKTRTELIAKVIRSAVLAPGVEDPGC